MHKRGPAVRSASFASVHLFSTGHRFRLVLYSSRFLHLVASAELIRTNRLSRTAAAPDKTETTDASTPGDAHEAQTSSFIRTQEAVYGDGFLFTPRFGELVQLVRDFHQFTSKNEEVFDTGQDYSLYAGSLLGFERHQSVIPYEDDVDVVAPERFFRKVVEYGLQNGIADDPEKPWVVAPLGKEKRVAIIFQTRKLQSVDRVFAVAEADYILTLGNKDWVRFGGDESVFSLDKSTWLNGGEGAHGTLEINYGGVNFGARLFMKHKTFSGGAGRRSDESGAARGNLVPEAEKRTIRASEWHQPLGKGGNWYTHLDIFTHVNVSPTAGGGCQMQWSPLHTPDADFPETQLGLFNGFPVRVFKAASARKQLLHQCYGEDGVERPLMRWVAGDGGQGGSWAEQER